MACWTFARSSAARFGASPGTCGTWCEECTSTCRMPSLRQTPRFRLEPTDGAAIAYQLDGDFGGTLPVDVEVLPTTIEAAGFGRIGEAAWIYDHVAWALPTNVTNHCGRRCPPTKNRQIEREFLAQQSSTNRFVSLRQRPKAAGHCRAVRHRERIADALDRRTARGGNSRSAGAARLQSIVR